jgi:hypothetical protein
MLDLLRNLNSLIKQEADEILYKKGLINILNSFGTPHIHGSYALDLMTWRDLDIYLETDNIAGTGMFELGKKINDLLAPVKMSFRNELLAKTPGLPAGLYWGIYLGNERAGAWKIDIWVVSPSECQRLLEYTREIKQKLTSAASLSILEIKSQCWQDHEYRRSYTSADIYTAVLENNIANVEEFRNYLRNKG